jgi:hypothetical protein
VHFEVGYSYYLIFQSSSIAILNLLFAAEIEKRYSFSGYTISVTGKPVKRGLFNDNH